MAIQHYEGSLGKFDYDDEEFELFELLGFNDLPLYLRYIGSKSDGSEIHIPDGIVDCNRMFYDCTFLQTSPIIPDGVITCTAMFRGCGHLKTPPIIPDSVEYCTSMFNGCRSLIAPPVIPGNVTDCSYMFNLCESLKTPPIISEGIVYCDHMLDGCASLKVPPIIPESVEVNACENMFQGCSKKIQAWGEWNINHRGQDMRDTFIKGVQRSVVMYKQHKQDAVDRARMEKDVEDKMDITGVNFASSCEIEQGSMITVGNDVSMEA